eukprot:gene4211-6557_t
MERLGDLYDFPFQHAPEFSPSMSKKRFRSGYSNQPFLTRLREVDANEEIMRSDDREALLHIALHQCYPGPCRFPNIDVNGKRAVIKGWSHAKHVLTDGILGKECCWAAFVTDLKHPKWWPSKKSVPTYDQIILAAGHADIGCHQDVYGDERKLVATYLAISSGEKRCILLPPTESWLKDRADFQLAVSDPSIVSRIHESGGFIFNLKPEEDGTPILLYIPCGWYHWLHAKSDTSIVFGGSIFMDI